MRFIEEFKKLKAVLNDGDARYKLQVSSLALKTACVKHILSDGTIADHRDIEERPLKSEGHEGTDLFLSLSELLAEAYRKRARKIAYAEMSEGIESKAMAE